ncbi:response regulator, partial [Vibrio cyclitrophicus]
DGFEATRKIREFDMQVPIIAMSANVFADAKQRARDAGVTDFLDKPIIIDEASSLLIKYIVPEVMVEGKAAPLTDQVVSSAENDDHSIDENSEESPVFSKQRFEQLTQSDVELQDKLLRKFDNSAPKIMAEAFESHEKGEWVNLERSLHTLKSMAASIGGVRLAGLLSDLEAKAHAKECHEFDLQEGKHGLLELIKAIESQFDKSQVVEAVNLGALSSTVTEKQRVKLLSLLEAYDNEAAQYVSELLVLYPSSAELKEVQRALDGYDFERATDVIRTFQ